MWSQDKKPMKCLMLIFKILRQFVSQRDAKTSVCQPARCKNVSNHICPLSKMSFLVILLSRVLFWITNLVRSDLNLSIYSIILYTRTCLQLQVWSYHINEVLPSSCLEVGVTCWNRINHLACFQPVVGTINRRPTVVGSRSPVQVKQVRVRVSLWTYLRKTKYDKIQNGSGLLHLRLQLILFLLHARGPRENTKVWTHPSSRLHEQQEIMAIINNTVEHRSSMRIYCNYHADLDNKKMENLLIFFAPLRLLRL